MIGDNIKGESYKYLIENLRNNIKNNRSNIYINDNTINYEKLRNRYSNNKNIIFIDFNCNNSIKIHPFLGEEEDISNYWVYTLINYMENKSKYKNDNMFNNNRDMIKSYIKYSICAIKRVLGNKMNFQDLYSFWKDRNFNKQILTQLIKLEDLNDLDISNNKICEILDGEFFNPIKYYIKDIYDVFYELMNNNYFKNVFGTSLSDNTLDFEDIFSKKYTIIINIDKSSISSEINEILDCLLIHCIGYAILRRNNFNIYDKEDTISLYLESPEKLLSPWIFDILVASLAHSISCVISVNSIRKIEDKFKKNTSIYLSIFGNVIVFPEFDKNDLDYVLRKRNNQIDIINNINAKKLSYYKGLLNYIYRRKYRIYPLIEKDTIVNNRYIYFINNDYQFPKLCLNI